MMYFMFIVCLLHSFCFANSFFHQKTFFGRRVLSMKMRKNKDRDLFDKFEKYSLENKHTSQACLSTPAGRSIHCPPVREGGAPATLQGPALHSGSTLTLKVVRGARPGRTSWETRRLSRCPTTAACADTVRQGPDQGKYIRGVARSGLPSPLL